MKLILSISLIVFACANANAQQTASKVENVEVSVKSIEETTYNDITLTSKVVSETQRPALIVRTEATNPLVRAYNVKNPFPPVTLEKVGGGEYLLAAPTGSHWTIEILAQTETGWWTEYLKATIGDGTNPNPPPVDDDPVDDPVVPIPDSQLVTKLKAEWNKIPASSKAITTQIAGNVSAVAEKWAADKFAGNTKMEKLIAMSRELNDLNQQAMGATHYANWSPFWALVQNELGIQYGADVESFDAYKYLKQVEKALR